MIVYVIAILFAAVTGVLGYLLADRRVRHALHDLSTRLGISEQRAGDLSSQLQNAGNELLSIRESAGVAREKVSALSAQLELADRRSIDLKQELSTSQQEVESLRSAAARAREQSSALAAQLEASQQSLIEQRKELEQLQTRAREAFAAVSAEALAKNNEAFLDLARQKFAAINAQATGTLDERKAQIEGMLKPFQELLANYQVRLTDIEKSRTESYSMLREQLGTLAETQRTLNVQTTQLVSALRRPNTRGQWGEIALRRLVELAGMTARCDFSEQTTVDTEEGRQRPDMIVNLPNDRQIVIDCKAVLDAFLDATAATDEDSRQLHLQRHCQQVRARARDLGAKSYWNQFSQAPEYVVMFLPGEAFLYAAVEMDGSLIEDCLKNRVIVATPTTLIALLKAIEFGWRQEAITQNAEAIRKLGVDLYDRIATLTSHFEKLGSNLNTAVTSYNSAMSSLESRVVVTARRISELGARNDKELKSPAPIEKQARLLTAEKTDA